MKHALENCPAPAKLNLFLHVTGRRPDGYHLLQSAFQLIDHGDLLHFNLREDGEIRRLSDMPGVPEAADLSVRAARLLQNVAQPTRNGQLLGADIRIDKRLPMGGGLGGGSSDAATTLMALDHLWETGLSRAELMALGLKLGADVPFFVFGRNAFAEGIGETLTPLKTPDCWYVVLEPGVMVPTASIFGASELTRDTKPVKITDFSGAATSFGRNDLQVVASRLFPQIAEAIEWLGQFGDARMTGSGACVFCALGDESLADSVLEEARTAMQTVGRTGHRRWTIWKARALNEHPMANLQGA